MNKEKVKIRSLRRVSLMRLARFYPQSSTLGILSKIQSELAFQKTFIWKRFSRKRTFLAFDQDFINACNALIVAEETDRYNKVLTMMVDSVAFLELKLNALRRHLMKNKLPDQLK